MRNELILFEILEDDFWFTKFNLSACDIVSPTFSLSPFGVLVWYNRFLVRQANPKACSSGSEYYDKYLY